MTDQNREMRIEIMEFLTAKVAEYGLNNVCACALGITTGWMSNKLGYHGMRDIVIQMLDRARPQ